MKHIVLTMLTIFVLGSTALGAQTPAEGDHDRFRMDCRFYNNSHYCVSSATYEVHRDRIDDISYGVSCDNQTMYNDRATHEPQEEVSDGLRPLTAAIPKTTLYWKNALRAPGTYRSDIEVFAGKIIDGVCYVREVRHHDDDDLELFFN